jgi:hypothetical protein
VSRPVRIALWVLPAVVLLAVLAWLLLRGGGDDSRSEAGTSPAPTTSTTTGTPSTAPTTTAPVTPAPDDSDDDGAAVAPADPATDPAPEGGTGTGVVVTSSAWVDGAAEVTGYAEVVEEDGTCTLTLTSGSTVLTVDRSAALDATTTSCGLLQLSDSRLRAGAWTGTLTYDSATSHGVSAPFTLQIG